MKKFLLALCAVVAGAFVASATTVTFDFVNNDYGFERKSGSAQDGYLAPGTTATLDGVTLTFNGDGEGGTSGPWRLWTDGLRAMNKQNPTFTVTAGSENVTAVSFTVVSGATFKVEGGTSNVTSWSGSASSVTFVYTATSNKAVKTITVTYGEEGAEPEVPTTKVYNTVAEAIAGITAGYTGEAQVSGIVSEVGYFNTSYGSLTYYISDDGETTNQLQVYGGLGLNGEKFAAKTDVEVGAKVTVKGDVKLYNGTPEFDLNSIMLAYTAPEGGDNPGGGDEGGDQPSGDDATQNFNTNAFTNTVGSTNNITGDVETETAADTGITYSFYGSIVQSQGYLFLCAKNFEGAYVEFSLPYDIKAIKLTTSGGNSTNTSNQVTITADGNEVEDGLQVNGQNETYTVEIPAAYQKAGTSYKIAATNKAVNTQFTSFTYVKDTSAVEEIVSEDSNAPVEYFNLQGVRVSNPAAGQLLIKKQGNTVSKVLVK